MGKIIRISYLAFTFLILLGSCEGVFDDELVDYGKYMFWSDFDGPPIDIFIEGSIAGTITTFYNEAPACETTGCVTVELAPGTYQFQAVEQSDTGGSTREWDENITIQPNACGKLGLTP